MPRKKLFVKSFGCQMNEYDSSRIHDAMAEIGYEASDDMDAADVVVLNTCHIREKAAEKVYSELGRVKQARAARRQQGQDMVVVVAGCMAQAEGREIIARAPVVSIVIGPQSYHRLPQYVFSAQQHKQRIVDTEFPAESKFDQLPQPSRRQISAFLTVQEGCDKFCTFCVVPYTRGGEFSRPVADIRREAEELVGKGAREIMLLGQNVNAYHGAGATGATLSLAGLIGELAQVEGLERIRYTTSHPNDMSDDLLAAHRDIAKLMPYMHLPFQAGSDGILAAMNRKHTAAEYLELVERIRAARPDIALSTDIIVGFPGESEADFAATMTMVREVGYAQAFSFKYSARPGTPAADLDGQVAEEVKDARLQELQELLRQQQLAFNQSLVGKRLPVLLDGPGKLAGQLIGRSPYLQPVHVMAEAALIGEIVEAEIVDATRNSLAGDIYSGQAELRAASSAAE
jgi:tRNA-2-methylthio-N6-dimethylallyladenosine synthase